MIDRGIDREMIGRWMDTKTVKLFGKLVIYLAHRTTLPRIYLKY